MSIGFERPFLAAVGLGVLILTAVLSRYWKPFLTLKLPLGSPGGASFRPPLGMEFIMRLLSVLDFAGLFLLFAAAAGPRFVTTDTVWLNRGADIIFVLDVSPSMAGLDMDGGSRFDAARNLVLDFAGKRPSDALGLVAVGDDAGLLLPPTVDHDLLYSRLESLSIGELGDGTALGLGLAIAALHVRNSTAPRRAVVLITDGENNAGALHPETAAAALRDTGASLWVIGMGSVGEVSIDYVDSRTKLRRTGSFDSRFDPEKLKAIARSAGGTYMAAPSFSSFSDAFLRVDREVRIIRRSETRISARNFHVPLIVAALVLILAARFIRRGVLGAFL
jgi:Ca-activated chloride channel family protein